MLTDIQTAQHAPGCIEDVMQYIREHLNEPLDRETLAKARPATCGVCDWNGRGASCEWVPWILLKLRWRLVMIRMPPSARRSNSSLVLVPGNFVSLGAGQPLNY